MSLGLIVLGTGSLEAQLLEKLKKRSERAAEEAIIRKTEQKVYKETSKGMDSILNPQTGKKERAPRQEAPSPPQPPENPQSQNYPQVQQNQGGDESIQVYSKFDFVPGDKLMFYDDLSAEFVGDFPSKWNTNGSGEVVSTDEGKSKWLEIKPGYGITYIPDVPNLPEEYTIEFDVMALGLDRQTSSTAVLKVGVSDSKSFKWGKFANVDIPFCQYAPVGFFVRNGGDINNSIQGDIREKVLDQPHISIAVNKRRFRLWVDESKVVDIPRMIPQSSKPVALKFELRQFKDGKERLFLSNLKVAEGGVDLRRKLLADGSISTNGILFDSGSANLQPQSMGIIRQISQVLQQERGMKLQIVGHTDADGDSKANQKLSEARAAAVKNALVSIYGIDTSRLQTAGKGESEPIADNSTSDGKANNRRVVFVKS